MGSISILLIKQLGWRSTYGIMAAISLGVSAMIALLVREPVRGKFLSKVDKEKEAKKKKEAEDAKA